MPEEVFVLQDPPRRGGKAAENFDQARSLLRGSPGQWALIRKYPKQVHAQYRAQRLKMYEQKNGREFIYRSATADDGTGELYGKYVGHERDDS